MPEETNQPLQPSAGKASSPLTSARAAGSRQRDPERPLAAAGPGAREGEGGGLRGGEREHGLCALDSFWGLAQALLGSAGRLVAASP